MLLLAGCGPGVYTEDEALVTFGAISSINDDVYALLWARVSSDLLPETTDSGDTARTLPEDTGTYYGYDKSLTFTEELGAGGSFTGTLEGPGSWTGAVLLDGSYTIVPSESDEWGWLADIDASYLSVDYGPISLEGPFHWLLQASYTNGSYRYLSRLDGTITATGSATGSGTLDSLSRVTLSGGRYDVETAGSLGGWDISRSYTTTAYGF